MDPGKFSNRGLEPYGSGPFSFKSAVIKTSWKKQFLSDRMIEFIEAVVIDETTIPLHME
jgi:hypothetical protein